MSLNGGGGHVMSLRRGEGPAMSLRGGGGSCPPVCYVRRDKILFVKWCMGHKL